MAGGQLQKGHRGRGRTNAHACAGMAAGRKPLITLHGGHVPVGYSQLMAESGRDVITAFPRRTPLTQVLPMALLSLPRLWQLALPLGPPSHFPSLWTGSAQLTAPAGIPISSPR